jgi:hypothetical protein
VLIDSSKVIHQSVLCAWIDRRCASWKLSEAKMWGELEGDASLCPNCMYANVVKDLLEQGEGHRNTRVLLESKPKAAWEKDTSLMLQNEIEVFLGEFIPIRPGFWLGWVDGDVVEYLEKLLSSITPVPDDVGEAHAEIFCGISSKHIDTKTTWEVARRLI